MFSDVLKQFLFATKLRCLLHSVIDEFLCHFLSSTFCTQRWTASNHCVHLSMQKVRPSVCLSILSVSVDLLVSLFLSWMYYESLYISLYACVYVVCKFIYISVFKSVSACPCVCLYFCPPPINNLHSQRSVAGDFVNRKTQPALARTDLFEDVRSYGDRTWLICKNHEKNKEKRWHFKWNNLKIRFNNMPRFTFFYIKASFFTFDTFLMLFFDYFIALKFCRNVLPHII